MRFKNVSLYGMSALCGLLLLKYGNNEPWPVGLLLATAMILFLPLIRSHLEACWPISIAFSCILFAFMIGAACDQNAQELRIKSDAVDQDADDDIGEIDRSLAGATIAQTHPRVIVDYCRLNLSCWAEKNLGDAASACRPQIEQLSKSAFQWTDRWLDETFSTYRWKDREKAIVTFIGDKFRSRTIFGGWQFQIYTCDYDPDTKVVMRVNSVPGQLSLNPK